jgi:hypothetical protein
LGGRIDSLPGAEIMKFRKFVTLATLASMFFWAPSIVPVKAMPVHFGCGVHIVWMPSDTAYAMPPPPVPCPTNTPWAVYAIFGSAFSVILNSLIVAKTQCRELTAQEAALSALLPFLGIFWNKHKSACKPH